MINTIPLNVLIKNYFNLKKYPLKTLLNLAKEYGEDFCIDVGFKKLFILGSAGAIKHVLVDHYALYHKGTPYTQDMQPLLGEGLLTSDDETWQCQRKILQPRFHYKYYAEMAHVIETQVNTLMENWDRNIQMGTLTFDIFKEMCNLTLNIITHILFSNDIADQQELIYNAVTAFEHQVKPFHFRYLFQLSNNLIKLIHWRSRKKLNIIIKIVEEAIHKREQLMHDQNDLLSFMLATKNKESNNLSHEHIADNLITLFVGGHETTANSLAWAFTLLSRYPAERAKLYQELDAVLGNQPADFASIEKLRYTKMIIQETMRLYPPAYLLPRNNVQIDVIDGMTIPANSLVILNTYFAHYSPAYWENPLAFNPERFLPEKSAKRPHTSYLPFGSGPRVCLGQGFAYIEAVLILARIAQRYELDLQFNTDLSYKECITLRPKNALLMNLKYR